MDQCFSAASISGTVHRIAKDQQGLPALLLSTVPGGDRSARIRLEHLEVQHGVRCRITAASGEAEEAAFTVVRCRDAEGELMRYFLRVVAPILQVLGPAPSAAAVSRAVASFIELFRALEQPPVKSVRGLWSELLLMRMSRDPVLLLSAWHASPDDRYDFSAARERIEVKSSSQRERSHHFALEQLTPPVGCSVVIASVFIERAGGGTSLSELIEELRSVVCESPELQERLDRVVAATLGRALRTSLAERFDVEVATSSMAFYSGEMVPTIPAPLPWGISDVHFKADLSEAIPVPREVLAGSHGLFGALA